MDYRSRKWEKGTRIFISILGGSALCSTSPCIFLHDDLRYSTHVALNLHAHIHIHTCIHTCRHAHLEQTRYSCPGAKPHIHTRLHSHSLRCVGTTRVINCTQTMCETHSCSRVRPTEHILLRAYLIQIVHIMSAMDR